jgi:GWxTD domain-containing protein
LTLVAVGALAAALPKSFAPAAQAQERRESAPGAVSRGRVPFFADVSTRLTPEGTYLAEVLLELPYTSLRFVRDQAAWSARFDVTVLVYDRAGNQLNGDLWTIPLSTLDPNRDQSEGLRFRRRFPMAIAPGRLRVEVTVAQTGSGREGEWSATIDVPRYDGSELVFSRPAFGRCDLGPAERDTTWSTGDFTPVVRRRYGDALPSLCVSGDIYDQANDAATEYLLTWGIFGDARDAVVRGEARVPRRGGRGSFLIAPNIDSLSHGDWRLVLETRIGTAHATREEPFQVDESRLDLLSDQEMIRGVVAYIAGNEELLALESLPQDSLQSYWDSFWGRRDPSPGTPRNENQDEFLRRVEYVNVNFTALDAGWRTDMGRIYIRYGPPDQIERIPFSADGPPREIWMYEARNLRFLFVDTEGFGRFRLAGSQRQ